MNNLKSWEEPKAIRIAVNKTGIRQMFQKGEAGDKKANALVANIHNMVSQNTSLKKYSSPLAVVQAAKKAVDFDLEVNNVDCCVVPFKSGATLVVMPAGILKILYRNPDVIRVYTSIVRDADIFSYNPVTNELVHEVNWDLTEEERGNKRLAYSFVEMKRKDVLTKIVSICSASYIKKVKERSPSANSANSIWNTWEDQMWEKTSLRKLSKIIPNIQSVDNIEYENNDDLSSQNNNDVPPPEAPTKIINEQPVEENIPPVVDNNIPPSNSNNNNEDEYDLDNVF